jgi:superfamily II DNA or RNA helicase
MTTLNDTLLLKGDDGKLTEKMLEEPVYPNVNDPEFMSKIYSKREFHIYSVQPREAFTSYDQIKNFRNERCASAKVKLTEQQAMLPNFINPDTPYTGIVVFYGVGSGKTCVSIKIGEKFKPLVEKYGTKIYILVPGPLNKENFKKEIIKCTGETYTKYFQDNTIILDDAMKQRIHNNALNLALQYYKIMSYRSFYKKVLGEKIIDRTDKGKPIYRKTAEGDYERDISADRIDQLNNTLIIVDEAHNLTGNDYGEALKKIINNSHNLKIVLLTATPMKNRADDIVELLNFIRPKDNPIEREKIFTGEKNYLMKIKTGGLEYLKNMARGYISYLRGSDPITYAERVEVGEIPKGLLFTKLTQCPMLSFQSKIYTTSQEEEEDVLDRESEAIANFVFPGLSSDKKTLAGYHGIEGINTIKSQLKTNSKLLNKKIAEEILAEYNIDNPENLLYLTGGDKNFTGEIFKIPYLKHFSVKFSRAMNDINNMVDGKWGLGTGFIYSNLVKAGINLFQEVMLQNGYLEFQEDKNYTITKDTKCYFCGIDYGNHPIKGNHEFNPATFILITGKSEETIEIIPEEKFKVLDNIFNSIDNKDGKIIKYVLGSKIMNEGITLKNISRIFILDVHYNLAKVEQVIGRGVRFCVHNDITSEKMPFPKVYIHKYAISLINSQGNGELSSEETLYKKAELKYLLIKKVERCMKEIAFDCPLNFNANIFPEEIEKYKNCTPVNLDQLNISNNTENIQNIQCPALCDFTNCEYKCDDPIINVKYYDPNRKIYKQLKKNELDYSTFTSELARNDIDFAKEKIKELYKKEYVYKLDDILSYVKKSYSKNTEDLFDNFFVYKALDELIPITENDFNNFKDSVSDKYNRPGYLIYRKDYYIFQPFDENETLPMYYRINYYPAFINKLNLYNYLLTLDLYKKYSSDIINKPTVYESISYDFNTGADYYENRDEFDIVGIIDKESIKKKTETIDEKIDVFKIREKRPKTLIKKRDTGVPTFKGAVCHTAKDLPTLLKIAKKLKIQVDQSNQSNQSDEKKSKKKIRKKKILMPRIDVCSLLEKKLIHLEKYSTTKDGNKMTYVIVPYNHPIYPFPLNLEDRIKYILNMITQKTNEKFKFNIKKKSVIMHNITPGYSERVTNYILEIELRDTIIDKIKDIIDKYSGKYYEKEKKWIFIIE